MDNKKKIRFAKNDVRLMSGDEIIPQFTDLVYKILTKYSIDSAVSDNDDLKQAGFVGLYKAYVTYNFDKGVLFITYAYRIIENQILIELRKVNSKINKNTTYINNQMHANISNYKDTYTTYGDVLEGDFKLDKDIDIKMLYNAINELPDEIRTFILMYFIQEKKQKQIGEICNCTQVYVHRKIKLGIKILKRKLKG